MSSRKTSSQSSPSPTLAGIGRSKFYLSEDLWSDPACSPITEDDEPMTQTITDRDLILFEKIRGKLGPTLKESAVDTDYNLKRWLLAFDYDLAKVLVKLSQHLNYRKCLEEQADWENSEDVGEAFENQLLERFYPSCDFIVAENSLVQILQIGKLSHIRIKLLVYPMSTKLWTSIKHPWRNQILRT